MCFHCERGEGEGGCGKVQTHLLPRAPSTSQAKDHPSLGRRSRWAALRKDVSPELARGLAAGSRCGEVEGHRGSRLRCGGSSYGSPTLKRCFGGPQ